MTLGHEGIAAGPDEVPDEAEADGDANLKVGDQRLSLQLIHPRLVLCEGNSDEAVINALLRHHHIDGLQVIDAKGTGNLATFLKGARVAKFKRILIIADEDDVDANNIQFGKVRAAITSAKYDAPAQRRQQIAPTAKNPGIEVLMLPWDNEQGCIETVCLPAFEELYVPQSVCAATYAACCGCNDWGVTKLSEMKVHCLLSATQPKNPRVGLQIFAKRTNCPLNFDHQCFQRLTDYLRDFATRPI